MRLNCNFYAIMGGPLKAQADAECQRSRKHAKFRSKVLSRIGNELGLRVHGFAFRDNFHEHGRTATGVIVDVIEPHEAKRRGLRIIETDSSNGKVIAVAPYRKKNMQWFRDAMKELDDDGFAGFLSGYTKFPFVPQEFIDGIHWTSYVPRVHHNLRGEFRTVIMLGFDKHKQLEPEGLPEGLYEVTLEDGNSWLQGKCDLELIDV